MAGAKRSQERLRALASVTESPQMKDEGRRKRCLSIRSVLIWLWIFFLWETHKQSLPRYLNLSQSTKPPKQPKLGIILQAPIWQWKKGWSSWCIPFDVERWLSNLFQKSFGYFLNFPSNIDLRTYLRQRLKWESSLKGRVYIHLLDLTGFIVWDQKQNKKHLPHCKVLSKFRVLLLKYDQR